MSRLISKTLFSFLFIFSLSMPMQAAEAPTTDAIASAQLKSDEDPANKINTSFKGCELSKMIESKAKFLSGDKSDTPKDCNINIKQNYSEVDAITRIILSLPSIIAFLVALAFGIAFRQLEILAGRKVNYSRYAILTLMTVLLTAPWYKSTTESGYTSHSSNIELIAMVGFKVTSDDVNKRVAEIIENKLYYFGTVRLPDYSGLTGQFESIMDFMKLSNGADTDIPFTFYFVEKSGDLYGRISSGYYSGSLTLPIDENCVRLSKEYGLSDCRQYQIDWYKKNVSDIMTRLNNAKNNYLYGFNNASVTMSKKFDMNMSCDNIERLDVTGYNQVDIDGMYLKKVATCLSQDFTYKLHKLKNITTDEYLNNKNFLKSRRVSLCAHDESGTFKKAGYTKSAALEKVKACVDTACGADGSPYMCSAAVATFNSLQGSKNYYWHRIPAYLIGDVGVNLTYNAEKFGRRFMFEYEKNSTPTVVNNNAKTIFTLSYPKLKGYDAAEYGWMEKTYNWMGDQYQYYMGVAMEFNIDQLNSLGNIGQDGWFGMTRLSTCIANPHKYVDGYLCGGMLQETMSTGAANIKAGVDMLVASTASMGKIKGTQNSTAAEIAQSKNYIQKIVPLKAMGIVGYFVASSNENNIYTTNNGGLETNATNAGLAIASAVGGPEITSTIRTVGWARIAYGVMLYFVLPFMLLARFLKAMAELFLHFGMTLTLAMMSFVEAPLTTGSMSNTFSRKENDVPDFIITVFLIISFPLHLLFALYFVDFFTNTTFTVYPVSLMEISNFLTSGSFSQGSAVASFGTNTLNTLFGGLVLYTHYRIFFAVIGLIPMLQGWLLFGNGEFSSDSDQDNDLKRYMSKF